MQNFVKIQYILRHIIAIFLAIILLNHKVTNAFASIAYQYLENASYYLLIDADTSEILKSRNINEKISPSSMTKLMTAYVVFDQIKKGSVRLDNRCMIGKDAWRKSGSSMFLN